MTKTINGYLIVLLCRSKSSLCARTTFNNKQSSFSSCTTSAHNPCTPTNTATKNAVAPAPTSQNNSAPQSETNAVAPLPPLPKTSLGTTRSAELRQWNLQNVDVKNVVEEVARVTGKNFIIDPELTGNVTFISNEQMTTDELYELFLSMLQVLGFAAVESDGVVKIVPDAKARQFGYVYCH